MKLFVMFLPSRRRSFCLRLTQNLGKTFVFALAYFFSGLNFLSSLTATDTTMIDDANRYILCPIQPEVCCEAKARVEQEHGPLFS